MLPHFVILFPFSVFLSFSSFFSISSSNSSHSIIVHAILIILLHDLEIETKWIRTKLYPSYLITIKNLQSLIYYIIYALLEVRFSVHELQKVRKKKK